jgi:hypothetical protein
MNTTFAGSTSTPSCTNDMAKQIPKWYEKDTLFQIEGNMQLVTSIQY